MLDVATSLKPASCNFSEKKANFKKKETNKLLLLEHKAFLKPCRKCHYD